MNWGYVLKQHVTCVNYFEHFVLPTIKSYIKKLDGVHASSFRRKELWTANVSKTLNDNSNLLMHLFNSYKTTEGQRRFSIESAQHLTAKAGLKLDRMEPTISHEERVRRLFAQSK